MITVSVCLCSDALSQITLVLGYLFPAAPAKHSPAPYLGRGYLLRAAPPDLERGAAPLGPPAPAQPPLPGRGVAPVIY